MLIRSYQHVSLAPRRGTRAGLFGRGTFGASIFLSFLPAGETPRGRPFRVIAGGRRPVRMPGAGWGGAEGIASPCMCFFTLSPVFSTFSRCRAWFPQSWESRVSCSPDNVFLIFLLGLGGGHLGSLGLVAS